MRQLQPGSSAVSKTDTISGNLLLGWYNQLPAYDIWDMNPWFDKVEEGYGSVEGLMTLSQFLNQRKAIEDSSAIPDFLPASSKPFRLTFGVGRPDELPTADGAAKVYIDLTEAAANVISDPDTDKDYFTIVAKENDATCPLFTHLSTSCGCSILLILKLCVYQIPIYRLVAGIKGSPCRGAVSEAD